MEKFKITMKTILILLTVLNSFGQEPQIETILIYEYKEGIKEITPKEIIIEDKVYEVKEGIRELLPKYEIERQKNNFEESWQKEF